MIDKVAKGIFYFDPSSGGENLSATYEAQAVDGDGNAAHKVEAGQVEGGPEIYTAQPCRSAHGGKSAPYARGGGSWKRGLGGIFDLPRQFPTLAGAQARVSTAGKQLKGSLSTCQ
jgi:hypothetical protein